MYPRRNGVFGCFYFAFLFVLAACCPLMRAASASGVQWKPISAEESQLTKIEGYPGASAVCLFTEVMTDDLQGSEHHYVRIKVLTEDGLVQGNLEIAYIKEARNVTNLHVRTIQPNGAIAEDPEAPVDRVIVRYRRFKTFAKTLAVPGVQPGTIIEYQYDLTWDRSHLYGDPWVVNGDLYTLKATFARRPNPFAGLRYAATRLPQGAHAARGTDGLIHLELENIPPTIVEDFMLPEAETRPRVDFYYYNFYRGQYLGTDLDVAWVAIGRSLCGSLEKFFAKESGIAASVSAVVEPNDSPEVRLRKLYDRVQALRSLSFEEEWPSTENKRGNLKLAENVGEVLKHGYGWTGELNELFLAMIKHAGISGTLLNVARRDGELFFEPASLSLSELPGRAVLVKLDGKEYFLDPSRPLLPFGWLPWAETSVKALRLDVSNGGLIDTPSALTTNSAVERRARVKLDQDGNIEGTVTIIYSGFEAIDRRFESRALDSVARRQHLENELQKWIPRTSEVALVNEPEWSRADATMTAEFRVQIKNWATMAGQRLFCPQSLFLEEDRSAFSADSRVHDIYFPFPRETRDWVSVLAPTGFRVEGLPVAKARDLKFLAYKTESKQDEATVEVSRKVSRSAILLGAKAYDGVRTFYQDLQAADESPIVFSVEKATQNPRPTRDSQK